MRNQRAQIFDVWVGALVIVFVLLPAIGFAKDASKDKMALNHELLKAAQRADVAKVKRLLDEGADPNAHDAEGESVTSWAAGAGSVEIVRLLLKKGLK